MDSVSNNEEVIINLGDLFRYLQKRLWKIVIVTLALAIISGVVTRLFISNKYASNARIFVKPEVSDNSTYNYTNIYANNYMVENYVEMIKGNNIQTKVANELGCKVDVIKQAVSVKSVDNTQIISITAITSDSSLSKSIVDETVDVFIKEMKDSLGVTNISIVDEAVKSKSPVSPSLKKNVALGAAVGLILMVGFYFMKFVLDTHIHNKEEAEKYLGIPNLGTIAFKGE